MRSFSYGQLSKREKEQGGSSRDFRREVIEPFEQDCRRCRDFVNKINKIQSNGQFVPDRELGERVTLGMKCFFFEPDGQPKKIAQFPSNLCHVVLEQVGIVTNKKAPVKKQTF